MCLLVISNEDANIEKKHNKKPHLLGKKVGKNNIKIMKKIRI